ncbi:flagellar biosynthetic protein FliO [Salinibacterium sp. SYSU T00001]|nr:flagellar biosynthetic protein FliO [Salinibacterium sedimenticola]
METLMIGLRVLVSLGAVLALLWWLHRRLSSGPRATKVNPVTVVSKQGIAAKASVVVIDVEGSRLVLGVTEQSVSVLQTTEAPAPAEEFAASMDAALASPTPVRAPVPIAAFNPAQFGQKSPIAGSILSLDTWRQAATTLRRAR